MATNINTQYVEAQYKGPLNLLRAERYWILIRLNRFSTIREAAESLSITESCLHKKIYRHCIFKELSGFKIHQEKK